MAERTEAQREAVRLVEAGFSVRFAAEQTGVPVVIVTELWVCSRRAA